MTHEQANTELTRAKHALDDAIMLVARYAQDLSDGADTLQTGYFVEPEEMVALRNALAHWKACTETFLRAVDEVGTISYEAARELKKDPEPLPLTDHLHLQAARRAWAAQIAESDHRRYGEAFHDALIAFDTDLQRFVRNGGAGL